MKWTGFYKLDARTLTFYPYPLERVIISDGGVVGNSTGGPQIVFDSTNDILKFFGATETHIGSSSNYMRVNDVGNVSWKGGGGVSYGEIWVRGNTSATVIPAASSYVQFIGFGNNGQSNVSTPESNNNHIIAGTSGTFLVTCSFHTESVGGGAADTIDMEIRTNNGVTRFNNLHTHRKLAGGGGDIGSMSMSGLAALAATDTVELWLSNDDNATNILVADANISITLKGAK